MKQVIVHPVVSYAVLGTGVCIALLFIWQAYETASYIQAAADEAAAYHQVIR